MGKIKTRVAGQQCSVVEIVATTTVKSFRHVERMNGTTLINETVNRANEVGKGDCITTKICE